VHANNPLDSEVACYRRVPRSVPEARRHTRTVLERWNAPTHLAAPAQLAVSELMTNSVIHTRANPWHRDLPELHEAFARAHASLDQDGPHDVVLTLGMHTDHLMIEVTDPSPVEPYIPISSLMKLGPDAYSALPQEWGYGLIIIQSTALVWGVHPGDAKSRHTDDRHGKTVWAALDLAPSTGNPGRDAMRVYLRRQKPHH